MNKRKVLLVALLIAAISATVATAYAYAREQEPETRDGIFYAAEWYNITDADTVYTLEYLKLEVYEEYSDELVVIHWYDTGQPPIAYTIDRPVFMHDVTYWKISQFGPTLRGPAGTWFVPLGGTSAVLWVITACGFVLVRRRPHGDFGVGP
jgi:hypothetical protein